MDIDGFRANPIDTTNKSFRLVSSFLRIVLLACQHTEAISKRWFFYAFSTSAQSVLSRYRFLLIQMNSNQIKPSVRSHCSLLVFLCDHFIF